MNQSTLNIIAFLAGSLPVIYLSWRSLVATVFLYVTVRVEERENLSYFGDEYRRYMKRTKRFVPWLW